MKRTALYIINPASGIGRQKDLEKLIRKETDDTRLDIEVVFSERPGHAFTLSQEAAGKYDVVVAVGGDGTVNEVGRGLIHSSTALGIIPTGSGNGLARFLEMPFKVNKALEVINKGTIKSIDVIKLNDYYSLNVAGVGFDAYISHRFAGKKKRGPLAYMQLISKEFPKYKSDRYTLEIDEEKLELDAFLISFANSSQYGNNFHIAPQARIDDGLIDVCLIKDFPKYTAPALLISLVDQSIDKSKYDKIVKARKVTLKHPTPLLGHVDGEPVEFGKDVDIEILPLALKVVIPPVHLRQSSNILQPLMEMIPIGI
ncbi:diacylglycerol/lipid kinase family protein [Marinilabilia rubra]|uniref:Diacylglycerol kinase n=1 Tax=Marinilabilia rubra TaxID=2162893 RepID=A0A2U2BCI1_9BACT|nr:diacylglycerol kinase family protein [Marinilabilia rubra]PWE00785.1 diacylglycerol kinase [Marinilabilia rubra]